ncbi:hypothetical protein JXA80_00035 [bacterium]|nr:hypothetical protein [candidate division CSSED10-310 bacterium]
MMKHVSIVGILVFTCLLGVAAASDGDRLDVFFENFEADDGGLIGTLDWEWGDYAWTGTLCDSANYPPPAAFSGNRMWGTVLNDCYVNRGNNTGYNTCVNGNTADDSILTFTVDLTGYTDGTLTFYEWFDVFLTWDWVEVYVNGTVVFQHCGTSFSQPTAWVLQTIDLTPYAGGPVTVAFHLMTSTVINHAGWYLDDIRISTTGSAPTATPTPDVTPTPTETPTLAPTDTPAVTPTATPPLPVPAAGSGGIALILLVIGGWILLAGRR